MTLLTLFWYEVPGAAGTLATAHTSRLALHRAQRAGVRAHLPGPRLTTRTG